MLLSSYKNDDYARRSQLVSLAYEVLRDMKIEDGATEVEMLWLLSGACLEKATMPPQLEADAPKERERTFMYSKLTEVGPSVLRRVQALARR